MTSNEARKGSLETDESAGYSSGESVVGDGLADDLTREVKEQVVDHQLPGELARLADRYERVVGIRDRFVWKWFHRLCPAFRLSTVDDAYGPRVRKQKTLLTVYVTLLDDLLEACGDRETFSRAASLPAARPPHPALEDTEGVDIEYLELTRDVWNAVEDGIERAPNGDRWDELFRFDIRQVLNSIRYAYVVTSRDHVANMTEAYAHGSHNMVMFPYANIDLMHSSTFDQSELPALRETLWSAQQMARIGNWVSTWERELTEFDFSSGVVIRALERGVVTRDELLAGRDDPVRLMEVLDAIESAGIEAELLQEWVDRYDHLKASAELESVDVDDLLEGMDTVLRFHLGSKGLK